MVDKLWASVPHNTSGSLAEKGRLESMIQLLSQSPTGRKLLEHANEHQVEIAFSPMPLRAGGTMLGVPRGDMRAILVDNKLDDAAGAAQIAQQLAAGAMTNYRADQKLHLKPLAMIQHTELVRAHAATMVCQVAHELREGRDDYKNPEVWNAVERAHSDLTKAYADACAKPQAAETGVAAHAVFDVALQDKAARARTENTIMNQVLVFYDDPNDVPGILFKQDIDVAKTVGRMQMHDMPYVPEAKPYQDKDFWKVAPETADKIQFFERSILQKTPSDIPVRVQNIQNLQEEPVGMMRNVKALFNNMAQAVQTMFAKPKLQL